MRPLIDLHAHPLWGIDDGPPSREAAMEVARRVVAAGTGTVVATPHVNWEWPDNDAGLIADRITLMNAALEEEDIALAVLPGAEIALTKAVELSDEDLSSLALGGGQWLLIEPPTLPGTAGFDAMFETLRARGHQIVIAHPERCPAFLGDRARLEAFVEEGMLASITASSLSGTFGKVVRRFAWSILRAGLVHNVASDFHSSRRRPPSLLAEMRDSGIADEEIERLAFGTPRAIIDGTEVPQPGLPGRRGLGLMRRLRGGHV